MTRQSFAVKTTISICARSIPLPAINTASRSASVRHRDRFPALKNPYGQSDPEDEFESVINEFFPLTNLSETKSLRQTDPSPSPWLAENFHRRSISAIGDQPFRFIWQ
jgi:hypothetical protein